MKKFISQGDLDGALRKELRLRGKKELDVSLNARRNRDGQTEVGTTIFLSHSHIDRSIVQKIVLLFDKIGANIYVDWLDKSLPFETDINTAENIRAKIRKCEKFLFLATYHGLRSKWCTWELGIADSVKGQNHMAILPIETKTGNWSGREYLRLYPEMQFNTNEFDRMSSEQVIIQNLNKSEITLENWIGNSFSS